ncbi:MAG: HisA/HisF-related TIM barrel protein [Thermoplasmata archaeon]
MQAETKRAGLIPLILLRGRTLLFKEYSKKALSELSKDLRRKNFEKIYIMDLDGLERNRPQLDIVQRLSDDFGILYEGGPRRGAHIIDFIMAGAELAYMNTATLESLDELEIALSYTDNVGLKVDWNRGMIGDDFKDKTLQGAVQECMGLGIRDFVIPVEVMPQLRSMRSLPNIVLRAIADRPGDERARDIDADSIIVNYELIRDGN